MSLDMRKELIIQKLKEQGCRITKQREIIIDIILNENCTSCKEVCYKANKRDYQIGTATVYRMISTLEELGAINRKNIYLVNHMDSESQDCTIEFVDGTSLFLTASECYRVMQAGLNIDGFSNCHAIKSIVMS